MTILQEKWK